MQPRGQMSGISGKVKVDTPLKAVMLVGAVVAITLGVSLGFGQIAILLRVGFVLLGFGMFTLGIGRWQGYQTFLDVDQNYPTKYVRTWQTLSIQLLGVILMLLGSSLSFWRIIILAS